MKQKLFFLFAVASFLMLALPTKAQTDDSVAPQEAVGKKTLPYPRATRAIPATAMEYDSIAGCFVVRDTIAGASHAGSRSGASRTVVTRAAVAYTEAGVKYGYFGDQLSSDDIAEMKALLEPWKNEIKNLDIDSVLSPARNGDETWYMQIVGVDNEDIDELGGEMRIYNDIGSSYDYKTISIDGTALRGNEHIKKIVFEDCASGSANASTWPKMVIHDGAFQNCKNLTELNMYYLVTDGSNHYDMLLPTDIYIGSNVFDGCHPDFRIVVDAQVYKMFITDANWSQYADKIVASNEADLLETQEIDGVKYGYFGYQLSSSNIDKMQQLLKPLEAVYRNLSIDELLTPASNGAETWYMQVVGVNNEELDKKYGEMRLYNDIGTTYNYKTIAIDSTALRGNEHINKVVFEDCASASENANTPFKMVIHDGAFKDCKNLKEFNMYYFVTDGTNHYEMLYPSDIYVGKNVFDGCHPDFRIVVSPQLYQMYITDECWGQYANKIVASDYMPTKYDPITVDGATYDYAAKSLNTLPTSELTRLQSSWWNAPIIAAEIAIAIATFGSAHSATTAAQVSAKKALDEASKASFEASQLFLKDEALYQSLMSTKTNAAYAAKKAYDAAMSNYTYYMIAAGVDAATGAGACGLGYISSTVGKKARREPTWLMTGQWVMTEHKHTIYHMYVKDVANKENVTLYNDIGSAYNYKTVAIGRDAFRGKDQIKTIRFQDLYDDAAEMYESMTVTIPDSAFMGCTGLETLDLIMRSIDTNPDRDVALGPENFIVCGEDIFVGCDTTKLKIRIAAEKYEEFAENDVWGKYKNCFEVVDVPEVVDYTDYGAQYSYSFKDNTLKRQTYIAEHNIEHLHIIGPDVEGLTKQSGELGLFNDIGVYNNYNLDYVKKKAFYGNQELKGISMFDLKGSTIFGDAYSDLEIVLQDSAFANCPNLEYINMLYFRTDGTNSVEPMDPKRVMLEEGVFAGSDKLKVKMITTAVESFKADTAWAKYEDRFLPSFILTGDETLKDILEDCGMEYESPITGDNFDIYDVMKITDPAMLDGKFQGKELAAFHDFKAFELINLTAVADSMFKNCDKMQSIELPSTIKSIGKYAFYNCALLDDIVIPDSVTEIKDRAFNECPSLKSITFLSSTPATLGSKVFAGLSADYVLYVPETSVQLYKRAWPQYSDHIQSLSNKHTGIYEVILTEPGTLAEALGIAITGSDPLTIRGNYSKYDSLKIVGPINGTDVGVIRFMGGRDVNNCEDIYPRNLKYLDLYDAHIKAGGEIYNQDGVNDSIYEDNCIDTYMFWELDALETLILPKSVTKIKDYAFNNCNALGRLLIGDNTVSIGKKVTHDSNVLKEVILLCNEAPATDENAWSEDSRIKMFYTPNSYRKHISGSRVYYTRGDSIASPFEDDVLLRALAEKRIYTMDDLGTLTDIENLINGNSGIKRFFELAKAVKVKELGDNSLSGCSALESVMLPNNVEFISAGAFRGCTSLKSVNVGCDSIPTLAENAFESLPKDFVIYVKVGEEDAYRKAWPQYADHIQSYRQVQDEIKVVTVTEPGTLAGALGFTVSMDTANDIGRISGDIVSITALKVNGPINAKDIAVLRMLGGRDEEDGDEVVMARMTYLDLYDATICIDSDSICFNRDGKNDYVENDNEIPEHMFWKLDRLQTVILPKNVTKIDDNAFYDCLNVETIVVGDSTVEIGNNAFGKCKNLKNIVFLGNGKAELDGDAFTDPITDQPYQVEKMYIPKSLYNKYVADKEYTTHTKEFCANYEEDALFRAYGSHAVMSKDQLKNVINIDGWFDYHNDIADLTSLAESSLDTLKVTTLSPLKELQKITLPATLAVVEENTFAANTKLQWADFSKCVNKDVLTVSNIEQLGVNDYALIYVPENFTATGLTNVVYGSEGNLKCDRFTISDNADYAVPRKFTASEITYDRLFKQGETTTICLPFDMELPAGFKAYTLDDEQGDAVVVVKANSIEAGKPYFVITDEDMTLGTQVETTVTVAPKNMEQMSTANYVMTGTFKALTAGEVNPQYIYIPGDNNCLYLGSDRTLLPYRAYVQATKTYMPGIVPIIFSDKEDVLVITDGNYTEFENQEERVVGTLAYTRTLNITWNALYVPFQIELTEELLANYDVAYINDVRSYDNDDDGELDDWAVEIIKIKKLAKLKANHPYLIRPKSDEAVNLNISQQYTKLHSTAPDKQIAVSCLSAYKEYVVKGLYSKTESGYLDNGNYVYAINKYGEWQKMDLSTPLVPFRVYLTVANTDGSPVEEFVAQTIRMRVVGEESEDGTTVIYDVEEEHQGEDVIYDLQGRRILEPKKGCLYIVNNKKVIF